jgi:hypothetical protein
LHSALNLHSSIVVSIAKIYEQNKWLTNQYLEFKSRYQTDNFLVCDKLFLHRKLMDSNPLNTNDGNPNPRSTSRSCDIDHNFNDRTLITLTSNTYSSDDTTKSNSAIPNYQTRQLETNVKDSTKKLAQT